MLGHDHPGLEDGRELLAAYKKLLDYNRPGNVTLRVANAVLILKDLQVLESYKEELVDTFGAELRLADGASELASEINEWVSVKTRGKITKLLTNDLPANAAMLLLNAIYFKGRWAHKFNAKATTPRPFSNRGVQEVQVDTMSLKKRIRHADLATLRSEAIELPYQGDRFSMVVVLPKSDNGLHELKQNLNAQELESIDVMMRTKDVLLRLPKFKLDAEYDLVPALEALGLRSVFGYQADLSGITGNRELSVSDVKHKAVVEVNEEGTEAAGVTSISIRAKSAGRSRIVNFFVNHPFLFYIRDRTTKRVLFMGQVEEL